MAEAALVAIPVEHGLAFAAALFCLGLGGVLMRRNLLYVLMSLELMLNGAGFAFVLAGAVHGSADGQAMFVLILALAAAEIAVALAMVMHLYKHRQTLDADALDGLRD